MTGRVWKPGDVAIASHNGRPDFMVVRTGGGEHFWSAPHGWPTAVAPWQCDYRPLVVIDPLDRSVAVNLGQRIGSLVARPGEDISRIIGEVEIWLRELTDPKPPEPTRLGAVVVDEAGRIYTRYETAAEPQPWWQSAHGPAHDVVRRFSWDDVNAVRVLSEGVQA